MVQVREEREEDVGAIVDALATAEECAVVFLEGEREQDAFGATFFRRHSGEVCSERTPGELVEPGRCKPAVEETRRGGEVRSAFDEEKVNKTARKACATHPDHHWTSRALLLLPTAVLLEVERLMNLARSPALASTPRFNPSPAMPSVLFVCLG